MKYFRCKRIHDASVITSLAEAQAEPGKYVDAEPAELGEVEAGLAVEVDSEPAGPGCQFADVRGRTAAVFDGPVALGCTAGTGKAGASHVEGGVGASASEAWTRSGTGVASVLVVDDPGAALPNVDWTAACVESAAADDVAGFASAGLGAAGLVGDMVVLGRVDSESRSLPSVLLASVLCSRPLVQWFAPCSPSGSVHR